MASKIPPPESITPTTPLRLEAAAKLGFPDGSVSVSAMRRLVDSGQLDHERIAGKIFVTLKAISEMRSRCRIPAKSISSSLGKRLRMMANSIPTEEDKKIATKIALDRMNQIADEALKKHRTKQ